MLHHMLRGLLSPINAEPAVSARYWRIYIPDWNKIAAVNILEMYEGYFGDNVCSGGTPFSSSDYNSEYLPSNAFGNSIRDGGTPDSANDVWASTSEQSPYIGYDFGAGNEKAIVAIGIIPRGNYTEQNPTYFDVQYSDDGVSWTTKWSESGLSWRRWGYKRIVDPSISKPVYLGSPWGSHIAWRLNAVDTQVEAPALGELDFRATPSGPDLCTGGTPSASSQYSGGYVVAYGFDNNNNTLWSAAATNSGWLAYTFQNPTEVSAVFMRGRHDGFAGTSPRYCNFQYFNGVTWTTAWFSEQSDWGIGEERVVVDPNYLDPTHADPHIYLVSLLLKFDGADGETNIVDSSFYDAPVTVIGNASLSTTEQKFGTSSLSLTGTGDYLSIPFKPSLYAWDREDCTIECFVFKPVGSTHWGGGNFGYPTVIGNMSPADKTNYWSLGLYSDDMYGLYKASEIYYKTGNSITEGTWVHMAMVNDKGTIKLFIDGNLAGSFVVGSMPYSVGYPLIIGQAYNKGIEGYIDSIRITKGVARYTDTFTPPTEGFPTL